MLSAWNCSVFWLLHGTAFQVSLSSAYPHNDMNFSCGCLFDNKVKEPRFKKSKYFEDLSASFAINAKNEQLGAQ